MSTSEEITAALASLPSGRYEVRIANGFVMLNWFDADGKPVLVTKLSPEQARSLSRLIARAAGDSDVEPGVEP